MQNTFCSQKCFHFAGTLTRVLIILQDGNTVAGDGCSAACTVECGYTCTRGTETTADTCTSACGDGIKTASEGCDDGNTLNGDGCSTDCRKVETEWTCTNTPCGQTLCMPVCGDGVRVGNEQCDDSGLANRDGCSSTCTVECGYTCNLEGAACRTTCGDGLVAGNETCDDDNENDGDGCSSSCSIERGWGCVNTVCLQSVCQSADGSEVLFFVLILTAKPSRA